MCRTRFVVLAVLAVALALPGAVSPAFATGWGTLNDSEQPGSVLVFHKFIRGVFNDATVSGQAIHARTEIEISVACPKGSTCGRNSITGDFERVFMRAHWVCGDCVEASFDLQTTINGSLYFNPQGTVDVAGVITASAFPSNATTIIPTAPCDRGYLIVWVTDGNGTAIKFDGLIGNAVLRDGTAGEERFSAQAYNAVPIQAGELLSTSQPTEQNGNQALDFDGNEYKMLTGKIFGTVRYENLLVTGGTVRTDLTLLTLDVVSNADNPLTRVWLNFYSDDEELIDTATTFECWAERRLTDINANLTQQRLGRKGLVESTAARQQLDFFNFRDVTLLGIVETRECIANCNATQVRDYAYSLYNDGNPVATSFVPAGGATNTTSSSTNTTTSSSTNSSSTSTTSSTLTFDDRWTGPLDGEYPAGVANWGSGAWMVSGPYAQFTTNSISYSGAGPTSASFTFVSPKVLTELLASNGGTVDSTVSISCDGNPTVSRTVGVNELVIINTGWTTACSTVTISSTNGWDTNFDNLTYH